MSNASNVAAVVSAADTTRHTIVLIMFATAAGIGGQSGLLMPRTQATRC